MIGARRWIGIAFALVSFATTPISGETSFTLSTSNDLLASNRVRDDLYSASLGFTVELGRGFVHLEERLFTDRVADRRFDETWVVGGLRPAFGRDWGLVLEGGAVHVGRGLFGESAPKRLSPSGRQ